MLQFKAEIKMAAGNYMGIPACLLWKMYQRSSESLNPFLLLSSCKYSCLKVSICFWFAAMRFWYISLSSMGQKQGHSEVKPPRNRSGELGSGGKGKAAMAHAWSLSGSSLKGVFLFLATV